MEPTYNAPIKNRRFRTEAEYRLWQHEMAMLARPSTRPGLVNRIVNGVRSLFSRPAQARPVARAQSARPEAGKRQTQTIARVTSD